MNKNLSILEETIKAAYNPEACANQLNKGFEQAVEGGKLSMKLAAQQNALFFNAITKALSGSLLPNPFGFGMGDQVLENYAAVQKNMLEAAMGQGAAMMEAILESGKTAEKVTSEFAHMVQESLNEAQKEIMEVAVNPLKFAEPKK